MNEMNTKPHTSTDAIRALDDIKEIREFINIEVDSESFEKTIQDGMENLSKEELGSIIKEVIYQAFTRCSIFSDMLVKTEKVRWSSTEITTLGPLAEAAIKSMS